MTKSETSNNLIVVKKLFLRNLDIIIIFIIHFAFNLRGLTIFITYDEGNNLQIAREFLERGSIPYLSVHTSILHPILLAIIWRILGIDSPYSMWFSAKLLTITSVAVIGALIYAIQKRRLGLNAAVFSSFLYLLSSERYYSGAMADNRLIGLMLSFLAIYFAIERKKYLVALSLASLSSLTRLDTLPMNAYVVFYSLYYLMLSGRNRAAHILKALFALLIPFLFTFPWSYAMIARLTVSPEVIEGVHIYSFDAKIYWLKVGVLLSPVTLIAILSFPVFILSPKYNTIYKVSYGLLPLLQILSLFAFRPNFQGYWIYSIEPYAALVSGSLFTTMLGSSIVKRLRVIKVLTALTALTVTYLFVTVTVIWLVTNPPPVYIGLPHKVDHYIDYFELSTPFAFNYWAKREANVFLADAISVVQNFSSKDDYILTTSYIVAFLSGRKTPPFEEVYINYEQLIKVSERYGVKIVNIQPFDPPAYAVNIIDRFLSEYVTAKFRPVARLGDIYTGFDTFYVRNDVLLMKNGYLRIEYDEPGWVLHNWGTDITSNGTQGVNIWCPVQNAGNNYIMRKIWLPEGTYDFYTRVFPRGNTILIRVDNITLTIKEPYNPYGQWILLKIGTFSLKERVHTFYLSFVDGDMNDIQDYLLIERVVND